MQSDSMDAVFLALASPVRRRILDIVKAQPGCSVLINVFFLRVVYMHKGFD